MQDSPKKKNPKKFRKKRPKEKSKFKKILMWKPKYNNIKFIIQSAIRWEKKLNKGF